MAKLALDWDENEESVSRFRSAIPKRNQHLTWEIWLCFYAFPEKYWLWYSLERIIIQKYEFKEKDITEDEIKTLLDSSKCLLVFDGYKKGTNSDIAAAVSSKIGNSFVVVTSRLDYMDRTIKRNWMGKSRSLAWVMKVLKNVSTGTLTRMKSLSQELPMKILTSQSWTVKM